MRLTGDLHIYSSDELIEREWEAAFERMLKIDTGSEQLNEATMGLAKHAFMAGWKACLLKITEAENRKDGIG